MPNRANQPPCAFAVLAALSPLLAALGCQPSGDIAAVERMGQTLDHQRAAFATLDISWLPPTVSRHRHLFIRYGRQHRVDPALLAIVALVESGGWIRARSPSGARGLMQVMPATGKAIAADRDLDDHQRDKLFEPAYSVDFGAWYLARQLERFGTGERVGSVALAAAAYNGGPGRLRRHLDSGDALSAQTERYVHWVRSMWQQRNLDQSETYAAWFEAGGHRLVARAEAEMKAALPDDGQAK